MKEYMVGYCSNYGAKMKETTEKQNEKITIDISEATMFKVVLENDMVAHVENHEIYDLMWIDDTNIVGTYFFNADEPTTLNFVDKDSHKTYVGKVVKYTLGYNDNWIEV